MEGSLSGFSLQEVLEMLAAKEKTGALAIEAAAGQGRIWLKNGRFSLAETATIKPAAGKSADAQEVKEATEEAIYDIINWGEGAYAFNAGEEAETDDPVLLDVGAVLAGAAKRQQEWAKIRKEIPSSKARVELIAAIEGEEVTLTKGEWAVIGCVGDSATVEEIGEELKLSPLAVSRTLFNMSQKGLIRCLGEVSETAPAAGKRARAAAAQHKKYIRRSLLADEEAEGLVPAEWASYYQLLDSRKVAARSAVAGRAEH